MGGKKGGGGSAPREALDTGRSKQLVKIVEVVSEGEVQGFADGERSIFFDNTPLKNADGSYNFNNTEWQARDGLQAQEQLNGFNTTEKEISVSTEVKKAQPLTRTITDGKVDRVRLTLGVSSLFQQNDNGDTNGATVDFKITVGSRVLDFSISGKYSSQYLRNLVIDNLPAVPFQIKVERVNPDSTSQRLQNKTVWASYTEIIDNQFTYPNTALIGIKFDSEYFANIPARTYDVLGIKVKVPSNYDPQTRRYSGLWDGSFKIAWTDNPAWILYDIVTNKRYGLGQRLGEFGADKWALYQVAQYCDQLVPDGFGNTEPRFTCNVWLTEQRSAYDVINDLCSIFRAIAVWNGTTLTVIQDRPADPVWTYTNANVIGGFSRQYSAMKARHNAVQVEYKDKENNYETTIEYVSDDEAIRKYGLNLKKVQAFGCTSRGQAYRTGRWILETERLETETITFTVGAEGLMHLPGDIIRVADSHYAGTEIGGRVLAVNGHQIMLDREIQINGNSYLSFINANAQHSNIKIDAVKGSTVTLADSPTGLETLGVWSLTTQQITARLYRAMSITENDDGSYTITALQHEPQKEAIVDNGAVFEPISSTLHQLPKIEHLDVAVSAGNLAVSWQTGSGSQIVSYDVKILKDGKLYALHKGLKTTELDLSDLPNGNYQIVIISRNASGQIIDEKSKTFTIDRPPQPQNVLVQGGLTDIIVSWTQPDTFTQTEIWASERNDLRTAKRIAKITANIYTHTVGSRQVRFYWLRHARGKNLGAWYQAAGLRAETAVNIDEELAVLNEKLKAPLAREVIETALPARNLELILTVPNLANPAQRLGSKTVYNQADGRLYTWNGSRYANKVPAGEIEGHILPNQLAAVPTAKLSGTISAAQLSVNSVGANHIQAQAVDAGKIAANAVQTAHLSAGAVRADHLAAGQVSADKLAVGLGGNLLQNPIFAHNAYGWSVAAKSNSALVSGTQYRVANGFTHWYPNDALDNETVVFHRLTIANGARHLGWFDPVHRLVNLNPHQWYLFSIYANLYRMPTGSGRILVEEYNQENRYVKAIASSNSPLNGQIGTAQHNISGMGRYFVKFKAPSSGVVSLRFRVQGVPNGDNPDIYVARPMLEECTEHTVAPSAWQNAGVTAIHGGSIITRTITAEQIAANTITGNEIVAGTVAAKHLAANSVTAVQLAANSVTAAKMNVGTLSAISSNIGTITAGTIKGTTISGNAISGGTISGTTVSGSTIKGTNIEGGTIKGARIEGLTIEAQNIIGDVVKAFSSTFQNGRANDIVIPTSPKPRTLFLLPVAVNGEYRRIVTYETDDKERVREERVSANISIKLGNKLLFAVNTAGNYRPSFLQGSFTLPANQSARLTFTITNQGGLTEGTQFVFLATNA